MTRSTRILPFLALTFLTMGAAAQAQEVLPENIAAPEATPILTVSAYGAQIYDCKADETGALVWTFREPVATLIQDGKTIGHHYPGPSWELLDGSVVVGKVLERAPGATADDIALLKLEAASHRGEGQLAGVTRIQRINTKGGAASGTCETAGALLSVPYFADYVFLGN